MKKYQSGGKNLSSPAKKTYPGSKFASAEDSIQKTNRAINLERDFNAKSIKDRKDNLKAESKATQEARSRNQRDPDVARLRKGEGYSGADRNKALISARQTPGGMSLYSGKRDEDYKSGGTIKKQTMKNKPAPKKKMSAKEMEAMKKAKAPMMKYGGKMGKKPC